MALVVLRYLDIWLIDPAIGVKILPEIGARHRMVKVAFNEQLIRLGHPAIPIRVPGKETEGNIAMRSSVRQSGSVEEAQRASGTFAECPLAQTS